MSNNNKKTPSWNETKKRLKETFVLLTENNINLKTDGYAEFINRLHLKLGKSNEEIALIIGDLLNTSENTDKNFENLK